MTRYLGHDRPGLSSGQITRSSDALVLSLIVLAQLPPEAFTGFLCLRVLLGHIDTAMVEMEMITLSNSGQRMPDTRRCLPMWGCGSNLTIRSGSIDTNTI